MKNSFLPERKVIRMKKVLIGTLNLRKKSSSEVNPYLKGPDHTDTHDREII